VAVGIGAAFGIGALAASPSHHVAAPTPVVVSSTPTQAPIQSPTPTPVAPSSTTPTTPPPTHSSAPPSSKLVIPLPPTHPATVSVHPTTPPAKPSSTVPTLSLTTMNVIAIDTVPGATGATIDFVTTGGWKIMKVVGPSNMTCPAGAALTLHCTLSAPVNGQEQDFAVTLQAPSTPAPNGDTMTWTYTGGGDPVSQELDIPGDG
jgi:hypothetical protein